MSPMKISHVRNSFPFSALDDDDDDDGDNDDGDGDDDEDLVS